MTTQKTEIRCEDVHEELPRLLDGTASAEIVEHVADCDACRDLRFDAETIANEVGRAGDDYVLPSNLEDRLLAALDARPAKAAEDAPKIAKTESVPVEAAPVVPKTEVVATFAPKTEAVAVEAPKGSPANVAEPEPESEWAPGAKRKPSAASIAADKADDARDAREAKADGAERRRRMMPYIGGAFALATAAAAIAGWRLSHGEGVLGNSSAAWSGAVGTVTRAASAGAGVEVCEHGTCAPAERGKAIAAGATVRTDGFTRAELKLADGTTLVLDRDGEIVFDGGNARSARVTKGALVADVAHLESGPNAHIVVPGGSVEVLGTKFALFASLDRSRVEVSRGVVRLQDENGHDERVFAGEEGRVARGKPVHVAPSTDVAAAVSWTDDTVKSEKEKSDPPVRGLGELRARKPGTKDERDQVVRLQKHDVKVRIVDNVARTEIDETFQNDSNEELEGIFRFPLPPDAQIERLALEVNGKLEEGAFVERDKAAAIWRGVIQHAVPTSPKPVEEIIWVPGPWRDPALLEWKRGGRFELRIFPIPAKGSRRVVLAYTQTVQPVGELRRYTYPLPHDAKGGAMVDDFHVDVQVLGNDQATPLHVEGYDLQKAGADGQRMEMRAAKFVPAGDLSVEYALPHDDAEVTSWAYQRPDDSSPYALLALRPHLPRVHDERALTHVLVVDSSRSMVGERFARAKSLATSMIREMDAKDRVFVLACDTTCKVMSSGGEDASADAAENANRFLSGITPDGATDAVAMLKIALSTAKSAGASGETLRVMYLGDGGLSAGATKPDHLTSEIERVMPADSGSLTTIAIGGDADTTVLAAMARGGGGVVVPYVPGQSTTAAAVSALAATYGTQLREPTLTLPPGFVAVAPTTLDTMRAGAETLVVARMTGGNATGNAVLKGKVGDKDFEQSYPVNVLATTDAGNAFVPRVYASLRIADLERAGGDSSKTAIIDLSKQFSVASRYTSLLVLESEAMLTAFGLDRAKATPAWTGEVQAQASNADGTKAADSDGEVDAVGKLDKDDAFGSGGDLAGKGAGLGSIGGGVATRATGAPAKIAANEGFARAPKADAPMDEARDRAPVATATAAPPPAAKAAMGPMTQGAPAPVAIEKKRKSVSRFDDPLSDEPQRRAPAGRSMIAMRKVWDRKGQFLADTGSWHGNEAAKILAAENVALAKPDARQATKDLFAAYAVHGRLDRAAEVADKWSNRDALDPDALVARADMAARTGDRDLAVRILGGIVDVRPDDTVAQNRLAALFDRAMQPDRACAHRIAISEQHPSEASLDASAVRCARQTGLTTLADRLTSDVPADKLTLFQTLLAKDASSSDVLRGDVQLEGTWDADADVDLALVDEKGNRYSWLGASGKGVVSARGATDRRGETLAIAQLPQGNYVLEVSRTKVGDTTPVSGFVNVRVVGQTQRVPFALAGARTEIGRVRVFFESRLVPYGGW